MRPLRKFHQKSFQAQNLQIKDNIQEHRLN